jgi:hypothetical protein
MAWQTGRTVTWEPLEAYATDAWDAWAILDDIVTGLKHTWPSLSG